MAEAKDKKTASYALDIAFIDPFLKFSHAKYMEQFPIGLSA